MNLHANAVLTVRQHRCLVDLVAPGWTIRAAAKRVGCSRQTGSKWIARVRQGEGLLDRSSSRSWRSEPSSARARTRSLSRSVSRPRLCMRCCAATANRDSWCVSSPSRRSVTSATSRASWCTSTSGSSAGSFSPATPSPATAAAWHTPRSTPTKPPQAHPPLPAADQRQADCFSRTMLERWACTYSYPNENARTAQLPQALDFYNRFRPHRALGGLTPLQRVNHVPGTYS